MNRFGVSRWPRRRTTFYPVKIGPVRRCNIDQFIMTCRSRFSHGADRLIMFTIGTSFRNKIISIAGAIDIPLQPYFIYLFDRRAKIDKLRLSTGMRRKSGIRNGIRQRRVLLCLTDKASDAHP